MRYRLRTLLVGMLACGAAPWLSLEYLDWQKDRAKKEYDRAFKAAYGDNNNSIFNTAEWSAKVDANNAAMGKYYAADNRSNWAWSLVGRTPPDDK